MAPVVAVALIAATVFVAGRVFAQPSPCCRHRPNFVSLYERPLPKVDAVLVEGDGWAFAALAQDPLLRRPSVIEPAGEFSYRAQRPLWGYLTWVASIGQPDLTGWALAALTILSCGAAVAAVGSLLRDREVSPWWALLVLVAAVETLAEFTPELLALALLVVGIRWWQRDRRAAAVVALIAAVLTRETMLVGVAALAVWTFAGPSSRRASRPRDVAPLLGPFAAFAAWVAVLTARTGHSPFDRAQGRLGLPGRGLITSLGHAGTVVDVAVLVALAATIGIVAVRVAHRDVLTWVTVAYLLFGALLGEDVWMTNSGFTRSLLPLFTLGAVAILGGVAAGRPGRAGPAAVAVPATPVTCRVDAVPR